MSKTKIIEGESFTISQPYTEGHTLSAAEARALNQLRSENIGNNMRKLIKEAKEKGTLADATAKVAEYDQTYSFAMPGASTPRSVDPVEREARSLAKEYVKDQLAKKGRKLSDIPPELATGEDGGKAAWEEKLAAAIDQAAANEGIIKLAKQRVAQKQKAVDASIEDLGL